MLRLVIFVFPTAYIFTRFDSVTDIVWWTFPIAELLTAVVTVFIFRKSYQQKIEPIQILPSPGK